MKLYGVSILSSFIQINYHTISLSPKCRMDIMLILYSLNTLCGSVFLETVLFILVFFENSIDYRMMLELLITSMMLIIKVEVFNNDVVQPTTYMQIEIEIVNQFKINKSHSILVMTLYTENGNEKSNRELQSYAGKRICS